MAQYNINFGKLRWNLTLEIRLIQAQTSLLSLVLPVSTLVPIPNRPSSYTAFRTNQTPSHYITRGGGTVGTQMIQRVGVLHCGTDADAGNTRFKAAHHSSFAPLRNQENSASVSVCVCVCLWLCVCSFNPFNTGTHFYHKFWG